MRTIAWIVTLPLGVIAVLFAISNRTSASLTLWPIPVDLEAPLYVIVLVPLAIGLFAGGFIVWVGAALARARARRLEHRLAAVEATLKATQDAQARSVLAAERSAEAERIARERQATALVAANEKLPVRANRAS
jgi:uncharacterized integral membrane protein